ncbi:ABC transporter permease [Kibdelosporangium aridum]|uniref:Putative ABC transport system permease protein n=1 Tax=Kibdelosporangium aridum TaxID=2030 RepID=A0A1W2EHF8_KIBAR|nr:ABC transporter permease [Kibdelosporangium aridum]SMD09129.1 putative ABC transport system permease protein [Kibdelosporangium aridum]
MRLRPRDAISLGLLGIRGRPLRTTLSCLGIAIGIACVVAVLGVSASSQAGLLKQIDQLGTNLLTVRPGNNAFGDTATLPPQAPAMIGRLPGVQQVAHVGRVPGAVYRHDRMPEVSTGGISILAASPGLPETLQVPVVEGTWFNQAIDRYPTTVLGAATARRLGVTAGHQVFLGGQWFTVIGVLGTALLDQTIDSAALVGYPAAQTLFGFDGAPTTVYERSASEAVEALVPQLATAANPADPGAVKVSRPSDVLVARSAVESAYNGLFLGLGGVALLVGTVGIANVMVIGVLERRGEIGLRRALGASRRHIRVQFLVESVVLSHLGGIAGLAIGSAVTAGYAAVREWDVVVPPAALLGGLAASIFAGTLAGIYPAARAARLSPTEALRAVG